MLEHPDAHHLVESLPLQLAIVAQLHPSSILDPGRDNTPLRLLALTPAERDPERVRAEPRSADHHPAPAAADVEEPVAGTEP